MIMRWSKVGLNTRTAILMIIPMVIAITVFGYLVTLERIVNAEKIADQRSKILVRNFSSMIELGMVAQDKQALELYADKILKEENVISVLMQDINKRTLVKKENKQGLNNKELSNQELINQGLMNQDKVKYSSAEVFLSGVTVGGIESEEESNVVLQSQSIGFVRVGVLLESTRTKQKEILFMGLISTLLGVIFSSLIGFLIARAITQPILKLNEAVSLLTAGRLSTRVKEHSTGEIGALEQGINKMAVSMQGAQNELLDKVDQATNDLNLSVSELEQRNLELEKSRRHAEALGEEKAQFLARMSHELRTPLNAVVGFSRLMGKEKNAEQRQEYAQTILHSATQLNSVIDDVLTFSKLKSGSLSLNQHAFSPRIICEDIVVMLSVAAQEKNIELILVVDKNVPDYMDGDALRISQVLTNLLNNAIKFTQVGEVVVRVECLLLPSNKRLIISVIDTGCGIDSQDIGKLFNVFSQLENTYTRKSDGVGLGLSISRRLAIKMGGDITVESKKSKGSCFSFYLPLLNPHYEKPLVFADNKLTDKTVLLFDSNFSSCASLQNMLQLYGMNVFTAKNIEQAETYLISYKVAPLDLFSVDLLVLSFSAEEINNNEYENFIYAIMKLYSGPILILSAMCNWSLPLSVTKRENLHNILKPLRQNVLCQNILSLLKIDGADDDPESENIVDACMDNMYVLVAEDNCFNQTIIKLMLEDRLAKVKLVDNGDAAIGAAKGEKFNLILMDLHMPGCDGVSAARAIRNGQGVSSKTPIVLVTADVLSDMNNLTDEGVIDAVLYKPIDEKSFDEVLKKCLSGYVSDKNIINNTVDNKVVFNSAIKEISRPLQQEVIRLCDLIDVSINADDIKKRHEYLHQLTGVCGYYQLNEVSKIVDQLKEITNPNENEIFTKHLSQIRKIISLQQ